MRGGVFPFFSKLKVRGDVELSGMFKKRRRISQRIFLLRFLICSSIAMQSGSCFKRMRFGWIIYDKWDEEDRNIICGTGELDRRFVCFQDVIGKKISHFFSGILLAFMLLGTLDFTKRGHFSGSSRQVFLLREIECLVAQSSAYQLEIDCLLAGINLDS